MTTNDDNANEKTTEITTTLSPSAPPPQQRPISGSCHCGKITVSVAPRIGVGVVDDGVDTTISSSTSPSKKNVVVSCSICHCSVCRALTCSYFSVQSLHKPDDVSITARKDKSPELRTDSLLKSTSTDQDPNTTATTNNTTDIIIDPCSTENDLDPNHHQQRQQNRFVVGYQTSPQVIRYRCSTCYTPVYATLGGGGSGGSGGSGGGKNKSKNSNKNKNLAGKSKDGSEAGKEGHQQKQQQKRGRPQLIAIPSLLLFPTDQNATVKSTTSYDDGSNIDNHDGSSRSSSTSSLLFNHIPLKEFRPTHHMYYEDRYPPNLIDKLFQNDNLPKFVGSSAPHRRKLWTPSAPPSSSS